DEVFGVEKAGRVGSIVAAADLGDNLRDLWKGGQSNSRAPHHLFTLAWPGAGRQRASDPDRAFIEVRQKLGADLAGKRQVEAAGQKSQRNGHQEERMPQAKCQEPSVMPRDPAQNRIAPLMRALAEEEARQHWSDDQGKNERS